MIHAAVLLPASASYVLNYKHWSRDTSGCVAHMMFNIFEY